MRSLNFLLVNLHSPQPSDYISVFSLRNWAKLRGNVLTSEQVYIHAKICIVDDRLAIIGSANINERSQRGDRDSELAAVIRDTDMIDGYALGSYLDDRCLCAFLAPWRANRSKLVASRIACELG